MPYSPDYLLVHNRNPDDVVSLPVISKLDIKGADREYFFAVLVFFLKKIYRLTY